MKNFRDMLNEYKGKLNRASKLLLRLIDESDYIYDKDDRYTYYEINKDKLENILKEEGLALEEARRLLVNYSPVSDREDINLEYFHISDPERVLLLSGNDENKRCFYVRHPITPVPEKAVQGMPEGN